MLNNLRVFKMARYIYLKYVIREKSEYVSGMDITNYAWGGPELVRLPPKKYVYSFAETHRDEFVKLWRYDVEKIISICKEYNIEVILMTYHINPTYLPVEEFISMANKENIPLVRNDEIFKILKDRKNIGDYLLHDNWHPNKQGYRLIAENVFRVIKETDILSEDKSRGLF